MWRKSSSIVRFYRNDTLGHALQDSCIESIRVYRRLISLSQAAMADTSSFR